MKLKADSLKNKIDNLLASLIMKKKRERPQINEFRTIKGEVTMNTTEIQNIIIDSYKQLYANKMDNQEEMGEFSERCYLPRLN